MKTTENVLLSTAQDFASMLFSGFTLKIIALGSCPIALIAMAKAVLS